MTKYDLISHEFLLSILDYDRTAGIFTWLPRTPEMFTDGEHSKEWVCKSWNTRYAGAIAGSKNNEGYVQFRIKGFYFKAHVIAWFFENKTWPDKDIDHIDNNPANNSINNLRLATNKQNSWNQGLSSNNTSGIKGVRYNKQQKKFVARIRVNGKLLHLGYFDTPEEAHSAYCNAAEEYFGEFARTA